MSKGKRPSHEVVADIKAAAYMFEVEKKSLATIAREMGMARRTLSRWRKTQTWLDMIDLIHKEG